MADWKTITSNVVYETPWMKIVEDRIVNHNGKELTYSYLKLQDEAVTIIATDDAGRILLQKQYRYPLRTTQWELPAGHTDGQPALEAAKRELLEETGLTSESWHHLGRLNLAAGIADIKHDLFLAKNATMTTDERDEEEDIVHQGFYAPEEVRRMLHEGEITDGDSMVILYKYLYEYTDADQA